MSVHTISCDSVLARNKTESQGTDITQLIFRSASKSIDNPTGRAGDMPFSKEEVARILAQARDYCANFEGGVIFYTNSVEFADYYTKLFKDNGLTNFRFVIAPVQYE